MIRASAGRVSGYQDTSNETSTAGTDSLGRLGTKRTNDGSVPTILITVIVSLIAVINVVFN
jgi:hypothetical protein